MYILTLEKVASGPEQLVYVYQVGEHVIGRGPELQCTSKKVSRKHALLKVTQNDGVFLESTHNNPCYHQSKNTQTIQIISFSKSIKLNNGDKISLALDHGWFVAKITTSNEEEKVLQLDIKNKRDLVNNEDEASEAKKIKLNDDALALNNENITEVQIQETEMTVNIAEVPIQETEMTVNITEVPIQETEMTVNIENITEVQIQETEMTVNNDTIQTEATVNSEVTVKKEPLDVTGNSTNLNANTGIKQEPLDESTNEAEVKQEPVGTSTEAAIKDEPEDDLKNNKPQDKCAANTNDLNSASSSLGNSSSRRDRCWYGSSCYRKNPTHRATFSHPKDADYDSDPNDTRPICCYGVNCYRRNKLHRQRYRHPGQNKIPDPPSKKKSKGGNHIHFHFRSHQPNNLFVRRIRNPISNDLRYIVIDFDALHPFDNLILDEDLDIFDAPSESSDSDYSSGSDT